MQQQLSLPYRLRLWLVKVFDKLCQIPKWRTLDSVLQNASSTNKQLFFIQIGANDGVIYDPIHRFVKHFHWQGILVEPVPNYFNKLRGNYASHNNLIFENVAISDQNVIRNFFRVRDDLEFLPEWCNGLGTFDRDVLLSHRWAIPNLEDYVVTEQVQCMTFQQLLDKHAITHIDVLLIDTEGHDLLILQQIDFAALRPSILLYEHEYISKEDRAGFEKILIKHGYRLSHHLGNTLAYSQVP
ncbi:MAG: FkbM family methyltransferase [Gammaproteobacteria bacterium]|nr:FkbM family methyltransferase [Gammaproteobacteria bacterium]